MQLQNIYNNNHDSILFEESSYFKKTKKNIIDNYILNPKIIRNNESIKFIDKKIIEDFNYKFDKKKQDILFSENSSKPFTSLLLKNGHLEKIENNKMLKFQVKSLEKDVNLAEQKFIKYQDSFKDDYIINLNSVLLNTCYDYNFDKNISQKVYISHDIDNLGNTNYSRNFININENSQILLIENFSNKLESNQNIINFFEIQKNSELIHLIIQNNTVDSNLQFTTHTNCYENSKYKQIIFNVCSSSSRNHHYVNFLEKNAEANLYGVFFGSADQIIDNKTQANHFAENCKSEQKYKGILRDNSKGNYMSKTYVDKIAQKTEAYQLSKGIILSENSFFHSKPELKIFADDVKCSHGSTIGSFDDNILFYMKSRGLSENLAISLLIKSFFSDILAEQKDLTYMDLVNKSTEDWLTKNRYINVQ